MDRKDIESAMDKITRMGMPEALAVVTLFMSRVERDGGIEAVLKDLAIQHPDLTHDKDAVRHAMICGGAIIMLTMGMGIKLQKEMGGSDLKSEPEPDNMEAQRAALEAIERIRKMH
jgi:hypothetical protein